MRLSLLYVIVVFIILIKGTIEKSIIPQRNNIKSTEITNKSNDDLENTNYEITNDEDLDEPTDYDETGYDDKMANMMRNIN